MAYAPTTNPPTLQSESPLTGAGQTWVYRSADAFATVAVAGYFSNAVDLGVKVGDQLLVIDTATPLNTWARFTVVSAAGTAIAELAGGASDGVQETVTALNTVGAGTITAAGIAGGVTARGGAQSGTPFTDTTDTAANIIAAVPGAFIGQSWEWTYQNNTNAAATLAGGTGVTPSGNTVIPAGGFVTYLVSYTAANTVTIAAKAAGQLAALPPYKFTTASKSVGAFAAGDITGAAMSVLQNTGAVPGAQTVRTAAQMLADIPGAYVGLTVGFRIVNTGAGTLTITADGGATVTLTGTMTVAQNVTRDYTLTFNSATTATIQSVGSGVSP